MSADDRWRLLYDEYFPFRLYADNKQGTSVHQLSAQLEMPATWIEERIQAARDCIERGVKLPMPFEIRRSERYYQRR